jgi:hypothetical protein
MSVKPHPEDGPQPPRGDHAPDQGERISADDRERLQRVHADPEQLNQESREQGARRAEGVNDPSHARQQPEDRAHGRHGKGFGDESVPPQDEQATDTGDDRQLRTAGGGGNQPPEPNAFRENSEGRMGGAGWGSEQVGGSTVDRRPDSRNA